MMTRLVSWLFIAAAVLAALLLLLPGFIDWTRHKDLMVNEISARLGQEVRIGGDVSLGFFPNPHVRLENTVIGPEGKNRYLAAFEHVDARMSLGELLHGRFVVDEIVLKNPVINIIDGAAGSNWSVFLEDLRRDAENEAQKKSTVVMLRQVRVSQARFVYRTADGAPKWELVDVNMSMGAASLSGPYQMRGDFMYGDQPVTFSLMTSSRTADGGIPFEMHIEPINDDMPEIDFNGKLSPAGTDAITAAVSTRKGGLRGLLRPFPDYYAALAGIPAIDDPATTSEFDLAISARAVALRNIKATLGKDATLAGDAIFNLGKTDVAADITLTAPDYWLSFDGSTDTLQRQLRGEIMLKAESMAGWATGLPDISGEVSGTLNRTSDTHWTISPMTLSLVEWVDVHFKGRAQRRGAETTFTLEDGQTPALRDIALEGKATENMLEASGTAALYGRPVKFSFAGKPDSPDLSAEMQDVTPAFIMQKLDLGAPMLSFEGGTVAYSGQLHLAASNLDEAITGHLQVTPARLLIKDFNPVAMAEEALSMASLPKNLAAQMQAALNKGKGSFSAHQLEFDLPLVTRSWEMKGLTFDGSSLDVFRQDNGDVRVAVGAGADGMPAYAGTLPLKRGDLPVDAVADIIRARNPAPRVDTQEAIGGILNRLDTLEAGTDAAAPVEKSVDPVDIFKASPPVLPPEMPPQPQPPLKEVEIGAPPPLPEDTPLAVDPPVMPPEDKPPAEIFPVE